MRANRTVSILLRSVVLKKQIKLTVLTVLLFGSVNGVMVPILYRRCYKRI